MNHDFIITDITRIVFVDKHEYTTPALTFSNNLSCNEIVFHISGKSKLHYNDNVYDIVPDTVRFLPKGPNSKYEVVRKEAGSCILVCFNTDKPIKGPFVVHNQHTGRFYSLFKKIFSIWTAKNEGYYFECISLLYKIFAELQKTNYTPYNQELLIKPAVEYIEANFLSKKLTAEDIEKKCSIGYDYIRKLFVKKFGVSPIKYAIGLKINYACDLLRSKQYSITLVAELCGYDNVYYFSRQFKEYVGTSPSVFVEKYISSK